MEALIMFLIKVLVFAGAVYGLWWICVRFSMPKVVMWLAGGIVIIIILVFLAGQAGIATGMGSLK